MSTTKSIGCGVALLILVLLIAQIAALVYAFVDVTTGYHHPIFDGIVFVLLVLSLMSRISRS